MSSVAQRDERADASEPERADASELRETEDAWVVARKRAILLLEGQRQSLAARMSGQVHVSRRYEDLCLVTMVAYLERDYLFQPANQPAQFGLGGHRPSFDGTDVGSLKYGIVPDWASPWGQSCLFELRFDLERYSFDLKKSRKWLSATTQRKAEARAEERFAAIIGGMADKLKEAELSVPKWVSRTPVAPGSVPPGRGGPKPVAARPAANGRLDLNQVTFEDLRSLRLSLTQSRRVLAYRQRSGGYQSLDELDDIPGFPSALREQLKQELTV